MSPLTARSVVFTKPRHVSVEECEVSCSEGALVQSEIIGISHGTEMLFYRGDLPEGMETDETISALAGTFSYPITYGYMNAGIASGGTRIFAFAPHQSLFCLPSDDLVELPAEMSFEDGIFVASMETALSIVQDLRPVAGETILVAGQGVVGLLVAEILSLGGLFEIVTADCYPRRRKASSALGCTSVDPDTPDAIEVIRGLTGGRGIDRAVNVSASPSALQLAIDTLAYEGEVVEASWYGSKIANVAFGGHFHRKRLTVRSSQVSHIGQHLSGRWDKERRLQHVIRLLHQICPSKYITHTFSLDEASEAFSLLDAHPDETIQVVLKP